MRKAKRIKQYNDILNPVTSIQLIEKAGLSAFYDAVPVTPGAYISKIFFRLPTILSTASSASSYRSINIAKSWIIPSYI